MAASDILAAFRWWAVLMGIGATAVPLGQWLFYRLPDRGYAFSKMLGLLLASYLFWLLASLGFLGNTMGGILLGVAGVTAASGWAWRQMDESPLTWLCAHWRYVLTAEITFALLFGLWVWVRAQNPNITATEKPMEFAFLNSAAHSPQYPPLDPWLSGFTISYYYFGYVMVSVVGRLAAVPEMIGFNLGIAWLVAGSGLGAFGLVYNLIRTSGGRRTAVTLGLMAAVALPLAGNGQIILEVLHGNGVGSADFWAWLDIRDINDAPDETPRYLTADGDPSSVWWWWRSSRVIHEYHLSGRAEEGLTPIAEFPGFSFVLGDMHPHVLALPFAFLSLALAYAWYRRLSTRPVEIEPFSFRWAVDFVRGFDGRRLLLTAVIIGGLSFLNTWDVLIHLFVLVGAMILGRWRAHGRWSMHFFNEAFLLGGGFAVAAYLLYWPFYAAFSSQAGPPFILPMLMMPTRLPQFLVMFGIPLLGLLPFLAVVFMQTAGKKRGWAAATAVGVGLPLFLMLLSWMLAAGVAASSGGVPLVANLAGELGLTLPPRTGAVDFSWGLQAVGAILPTYLAARLRYIGLTLLLAAVLAAVVAVWHGWMGQHAPTVAAASDDETASHPPHPRPTEDEAGTAVPFVLLLLFTGALLTLGPEYVYLKDNFGQRLNTIFKFYYQAWILWGVGGLFGLAYLLRRARWVGVPITAVYVCLFAVTLLFPYHGVRSRIVEHRGSIRVVNRAAPSLNGLAFLERYRADEHAAVMWLRENARPGAVVLEATGNPYSSYARVSANTGLPTVLGWANHEFQWRGDSTPEPGLRGPLVAEMYNTTDWARATELLNQYDVDYIFVGSLERSDYNPPGLEKFAERLPVAYEQGNVVIYRWGG